MNGERGATLLETLVALAITALLAATAAQVAGFGLTSIERADRSASRAADGEVARRIVTDALARIAPREAMAGNLTGDATSARWFGAGTGADGAIRVGHWSLNSEGALAVCREDRTAPCDPPTATLGLAGGTISYIGADGAAYEVWEEDTTPYLIRIDHDLGLFAVAPRAGGLR